MRLLGFCLHMDVVTGKQEQILVYEFVGNGDLERHISKGTCECKHNLRVDTIVFHLVSTLVVLKRNIAKGEGMEGFCLAS